MDQNTITLTTDWDALKRFAEALRQERGASQVLLFGSRARDDARGDSDYDLIVVSRQFADTHTLDRGRGLRERWKELGGDGPMDLFCLTLEEFAEASHRVTLIASVLPEVIDLLALKPQGRQSRA